MSLNHISVQILRIFLRKLLVLSSRPLRSNSLLKQANPQSKLALKFSEQNVSFVVYTYDTL